ncbi:hypothetical protein [Leifsonia shinshuensis]
MTTLDTPPVDDIAAAYDDPAEDVRLWELDDQGWRIFEAGFLHGYALGGAARQPEVDALEHEADRYYAEMCRRPAPPIQEHVSYAELCRRRGEPERATRNEELLRSRGILD